MNKELEKEIDDYLEKYNFPPKSDTHYYHTCSREIVDVAVYFANWGYKKGFHKGQSSQIV